MSLKIIISKLLPHLPGTDELNAHFEMLHFAYPFSPDDGIDARIHSIKIKSGREEKDLGLSFDHFTAENLVRFPKLENFDPQILYRRSLLLQR